MRHVIKAALAALPLLALAPGVHGMEAATPAYEGRINHVGTDAVLRMSYRGGQIRVKPRHLPAGEAATRLKGRHVRILDAHWREGHLEGRLEITDSGRS